MKYTFYSNWYQFNDSGDYTRPFTVSLEDVRNIIAQGAQARIVGDILFIDWEDYVSKYRINWAGDNDLIDAVYPTLTVVL